MIKRLKVTKLKGIGDHDLEFHPDLNILTGKNGSGKTTLLKLIWYMLSPNLERIVPEIDFRTAELSTDQFTVSLERNPTKSEGLEAITMEFKEQGKKTTTVEFFAHQARDYDALEQVEGLNSKIMILSTSSVFFPTFRRMEGGFSTEPERDQSARARRVAGRVSDSISSYSDMMTVSDHKFVASISTADIEELLTRKYAEVSDWSNRLHTELSTFIAKRIVQQATPKGKGRQTDKTKLQEANKVIEAIKRKVEKIEKQRANVRKPFTVLADLISNIFKDKGIRIDSNLTFGETKEAIQAKILSAGEKHMLSFLCYNAFNRDTPIFIDEPELSLHVDWQRMLFSTLKAQGTNNQFIVSTHSPFIYSKYPEKELVLHIDRGGR